MQEQFVALLKGQLELQAKVKDLQRRIGQALKGLRDSGATNRILIAYEGEVYSIERPENLAPVTAGDFWRFGFKREGKLL